VENGVSPCFIIFDSTTEPAELTSDVLPPNEAELGWERTIHEMFERRTRMEDEVGRLCEEGTEELARFEEFVRSRIRPECVVVPVWVDRVWRMTLELHMLSGPTGGVIGADRAWNAVRLSAWYLGRQVRLLPNSSAKSVSGELFKAKVLKKIRTKAPVSEHTLLRSFHRMSMAKLAETVTELVGEGLVRRENGKLIVTERGQTKP
jgi:hypothetical protein